MWLLLQAVDEFYSKIESQKLDMKLLQQALLLLLLNLNVMTTL